MNPHSADSPRKPARPVLEVEVCAAVAEVLAVGEVARKLRAGPVPVLSFKRIAATAKQRFEFAQ